MTSSQPQLTTDEEKLQWKQWNPNVKRQFYSAVGLQGKFVFLGGSDSGQVDQLSVDSLLLFDPEKQKMSEIPLLNKDGQRFSLKAYQSIYLKDSKILVLNELKGDLQVSQSIGIVTLKDLDSDAPSAIYEQMETKSQYPFMSFFNDGIYQDKLYAFGGFSHLEIWCFDIETLKWSKCEFKDAEEYVENMTGFFVFNDKAYISYEPNVQFAEFDVENLRFCPLNNKRLPCTGRYTPCPDVSDGKIYLLKEEEREVWSYDFGNEEWMKIEAIGLQSDFQKYFIKHLYNGQLFVYEYEKKIFWSLQLEASSKPKPGNLSNVQQLMKKFLIEAPYSDISFEVESQIVPAHKWWLTQKSKYFANMFSSGMLETQASRIKITDMNASTFKAFLEFLYSDHVELNDGLALELLQQADKYSVPLLKEACEKYLTENLTHDNYVIIGQTAELVDAVVLRQAVVNYVGKNMKKLKQRKDFEEISDNLLRDSIVKFIVK